MIKNSAADLDKFILTTSSYLLAIPAELSESGESRQSARAIGRKFWPCVEYVEVGRVESIVLFVPQPPLCIYSIYSDSESRPSQPISS